MSCDHRTAEQERTSVKYRLKDAEDSLQLEISVHNVLKQLYVLLGLPSYFLPLDTRVAMLEEIFFLASSSLNKFKIPLVVSFPSSFTSVW